MAAEPLSPLEEAASLDTSLCSPQALQSAGSNGSAPSAAAAAVEVAAVEAAGGTAAESKGKGVERASMGLSGLSSIGAGGTLQQRREWVLHKLHGLVDAVKQLEVAAYNERMADGTQGEAVCRCCGAGPCRGVPAGMQRVACSVSPQGCRSWCTCWPYTSWRRSSPHPAAGLPAFMLVVHSCVNLTRQCGTCLTALDPEHGRQLHAYYHAACEAAAKGRGLPKDAVTLL